MRDQDNILDFDHAFKKKNRMSKQLTKKNKSKKNKCEACYTQHALEQIEDRKLGISRVDQCLQKGRRVVKNGAVHYVLDNLHVVLDRNESTVLTAYNSTDMKEDLAA